MPEIEFSVDQAAGRAAEYLESDGLVSLVNGIMILLLGALNIWAPPRSARQLLLCLLGVIAYFYFVGRPNAPIMCWLKARISYPRTGYVALPPFGSSAAMRLSIQSFGRHPHIWVFFAAIFSPLVDTPWFGAVLVILSTAIVWIISKGRFQFAVIFIPGLFLGAILMPFLPLAVDDRTPYFVIVWGGLYALAGIIQLRSYLRRHPVVRA